MNSEAATAGPARRTALLLLLLILALAAWLRFHSLSRKSLWVDEGITGFRTLQSPSQIVQGLRQGDTGGPAYYMIAWLTLASGRLLGSRPFDVFLLRLPSVLFGLASIGVVYALAAELMRNRWAGLVAAMAVAVNRFHLHHSQEARNYTLYFLATVAAIYCLARLARGRGRRDAETPGRREGGTNEEGVSPFVPVSRCPGVPASQRPDSHRRLALWAGFILSGSAMIYTHYVSFFFLAALFPFYWLASWMGGRGIVRPMVELAGAAAAIALIFLPWLGVMVVQYRGVMESIWIPAPTVAIAAKELALLVWMNPLAPTDPGVQPLLPRGEIACLGQTLLAATLLLATAGWAAWAVRRRDSRAVVLAEFLLVAVFAIVGFSVVRRPIFMAKVAIPSLVIVPLGLGALVCPWPWRWCRIAAGTAVAVVLAWGTGLAVVARDLDTTEEWDAAVQFAVEQAGKNNDPIVVDGDFSLMAVQWTLANLPNTQGVSANSPGVNDSAYLRCGTPASGVDRPAPGPISPASGGRVTAEGGCATCSWPKVSCSATYGPVRWDSPARLVLMPGIGSVPDDAAGVGWPDSVAVALRRRVRPGMTLWVLQRDGQSQPMAVESLLYEVTRQVEIRHFFQVAVRVMRVEKWPATQPAGR